MFHLVTKMNLSFENCLTKPSRNTINSADFNWKTSWMTTQSRPNVNTSADFELSILSPNQPITHELSIYLTNCRCLYHLHHKITNKKSADSILNSASLLEEIFQYFRCINSNANPLPLYEHFFLELSKSSKQMHNM